MMPTLYRIEGVVGDACVCSGAVKGGHAGHPFTAARPQFEVRDIVLFVDPEILYNLRSS